jgi:hypothetical protein
MTFFGALTGKFAMPGEACIMKQAGSQIGCFEKDDLLAPARESRKSDNCYER